jgi:hypothetical protein
VDPKILYFWRENGRLPWLTFHRIAVFACWVVLLGLTTLIALFLAV